MSVAVKKRMTNTGGTAAALEGDANIVSAYAHSDVDTSSIYDSLLRGAAVENPNVHVDAEVGPDGKFLLQEEIGSGGMGRVYRALDRYLLREVAIKFIFRPEGMAPDDFMALFWQEAHIIARLDRHDNIVRILDAHRSTYPPFIVMEYLDGQSLEAMLKHGPIDVHTILRVMIAAACGLREAHAKGVYHCDLKPSNIFVQKTGRVKLLDFGLSHLRNQLTESSEGEFKFVGARSVPALAAAGTPAYMAPEQWRGEEADAATDIWALGAILYRLLAKAPPFAADSISALSARVLSGEPPAPLATLCPEVPAALRELVERLLRVERVERPSDVSEIIATLDSVLRTMRDGRRRTTVASALRPALRSSGVWSHHCRSWNASLSRRALGSFRRAPGNWRGNEPKPRLSSTDGGECVALGSVGEQPGAPATVGPRDGDHSQSYANVARAFAIGKLRTQAT